MRKYGIELEFFIRKTQTSELVPAFEVTNNTDGNPVVGEIRTEVCDNIVDCVFDLKKRLYLEKQAIADKGHVLCLDPVVKVEKEFLKALRENEAYVNRKQMTVLKELSVYGNGKTGKVLPRELFKASLQVNISECKEFSYTTYERFSIGELFDYKSKAATHPHSDVFDYVTPIMDADQKFSSEISAAGRVKGVYAIKDGKLGKRIEYRSLPNNVNLDTLIEVFK